MATPWLVPILLRPLVKVRGSSPRRGSSPLLIVPTPEGWKAEYTLASRMQINESLTVLAFLTRGEARTSDPWICSLMLYHLSYLTTYIRTCIHTYIHTHIYTYIHTYIASVSELLCLTPILVSEDFEGSSVATVCLPWERHCFKDGSYDRYQSTNVVAPWPASIAPKFKALGKAQEFPLASLRFPPAHVPTPKGWKAELALTDLTPQSFN